MIRPQTVESASQNWADRVIGSRDLMFRIYFLIFNLATILVVPADRLLAADQVVQTAMPSTAKGGSVLSGPELTDHPTWKEALRSVVLTAIPHQFEDVSQWNKTTKIFDGFRMKQRGFDIRIKEGKKRVNHGAWHRFKIELINPAEKLKFLIESMQSKDAGTYQFNLKLASQLRCRGDFEHWVFGVKGLNLTVVSEAEVRIVARCQVAIRSEFQQGHLIPDLVIEPHVQQVRISLVDLDVRRIGEIRGDAAEFMGGQSRRFIEGLLQAQEPRVAQKANEAIRKNRDRLRIPASHLW